jgi:hypothetical protein
MKTFGEYVTRAPDAASRMARARAVRSAVEDIRVILASSSPLVTPLVPAR